VRAGQRKRVPYEHPCNRRVNILAAYSPDGLQPALTWASERGSWVAGQFVDFVRQIPRPAGQPLVVVLDNGSLHKNKHVQAARAALRQQRIYLYYLPSYSPELNRIEAVFGGIKAHDLPARAYRSYTELEAAIDDGFAHAEQRLLDKPSTQPGLAA
jgi:putative transposase